MDSESALDVVEQTEVLAGLLERDDVLETAGVGVVGADLAVDLDKTLSDNEGDLTASQSVLELVAEEDLVVVSSALSLSECPSGGLTESGKDSRSL